MIKVWDPLLRLFHWSLVGAIALAWLTSEGGTLWHEWIGYGALVLIGLRLIWGLVGPRYARFGQFMRGPRATVAYGRDLLDKREKRYIGHNPLGAAMVAALLLTIVATGLTGWLSLGGGAAGGAQGGIVKDLHEAFANLLVLLIVLHVAGVIHASRRHHENLVRAMLTGQKPAPRPGDVA